MIVLTKDVQNLNMLWPLESTQKSVGWVHDGIAIFSKSKTTENSNFSQKKIKKILFFRKTPLEIVVKKVCTKFEWATTTGKYLKVGRVGAEASQIC